MMGFETLITTVLALVCLTSCTQASLFSKCGSQNQTYMDCHGQGLSELPDDSDNFLKYLDFSYNELIKIESMDYVYLETLNLSHNKIAHIVDQSFTKLSSLKILDLSDNFLSGDNITRDTLKGLRSLTFLNLRGNPLGLLNKGAVHFIDFKSLQYIDLSFCKLARLHKDAISDIRDLQSLYLRGNYLTESDLDFFEGLAHVETLDLGNNPLKRLNNEPLYPLSRVKRLYLDGCHLSFLGSDSFVGLGDLTYLSLANNNLESFASEIFWPLTHLTELDLSGNPMPILDSDTFGLWNAPVTSLWLSNMPNLKCLKQNTFKNFKELKNLSISNNNKFTAIEVNSLVTQYKSLRFVELENNSLNTLPEKLLDWESVSLVSLKGNPWYCDCKLNWIISSRGPVNKTSPMICNGPSEYSGIDLLSLKSEHLGCVSRTAKIAMGLFLILFICVLIGISVYFILRWRRKSRYSFRDLLCCACIRGQSERYISVYQNDDVEPFAKITFSEEEEQSKMPVDEV